MTDKTAVHCLTNNTDTADNPDLAQRGGQAGLLSSVLTVVMFLEPGRSSAARRPRKPGVGNYFGQFLPSQLVDPACPQQH